MTTKTKDEKYLARDIPAIPFEVSGADGSYLFDKRGKKYIDFVMGWCVGNIGWGNKQIEKRISNFAGPNYVSPNYLYRPWAELAEILANITPGKLTKSFRATGGTEAVEIALQAAMSLTKQNKFISIQDSYHGHSIGAMSLGLDDFRKQYKNLLPNCQKVAPPLNKKAGERVEALLKKSDVAAYISEPIICNLGIEIPTQEYFDIIQRACKKYGTLFIIDEVATGFGRTGKLFASEHFKLKPDIICLAKGLTGGYGALGATVTSEEVADAMKFEFSFYSTFGWQPINVEATLANLDYWRKNKKSILQNTNKMSKLFEKRLNSIKFRYQAQVKIKGLAIGLKFKKEGYAYDLTQRALQNGLLISSFDPFTVLLYPSLEIDEQTANKGLDLLEKSI